MRMLLEGRFSELSCIDQPFRNAVHFDSQVYSRKQALKEFARFLAASGLPKLTEAEEREERRQQQINDDILPCGSAIEEGSSGQ